jgi:hypothetical protein
VPQPDDGQEELVGHRQVEVIAATEGAAAAGPVEATAAVGSEGSEQLGEQAVEGVHGQAGHRPENGRILAELFAA